MQCVSVRRLKLSYYKAQVCSTSEHLLLPLRNMPRLRITDRVEIIMRDGDIRLSNRRGGTVYPVIRTWAFDWEQCIHDVPGLSADLHLTRMITWVIYYSEVDRAEANVIVLEDGHSEFNHICLTVRFAVVYHILFAVKESSYLGSRTPARK